MENIDFNFNNTQLSFHLAKQKHLAWKFKFIDFLNGNTSMRLSQVTSHTHCDCGKWLYTEIMEQFKSISEIPELESEHIKIHDIAAAILEAKKSGNETKTNEEYRKLVTASNNYIAMLDTISNKLLGDNN